MVSTGVRRRAEREEYVTFAFTVMSIYGHSCHTLHVRVEETFIVIMSVESAREHACTACMCIRNDRISFFSFARVSLY